MATIRIPTPLRTHVGGRDAIAVDGASVKAVLDALARAHPALASRVLDAGGAPRRFVNLFVNEKDVRTLGGLDAPVAPGDVLSIIPAIAGGAPSHAEILGSLRSRIREIAPADAQAELTGAGGGRRPVLVDVRESDEVAQGRVPGSVQIPRGFLELKAEAAIPDRSTPVLTLCGGGVRSLYAAESLERLGYSDVRSVAGGFQRWKSSGLPVDVPRVLSDAERRRYARHLSIPEVGLDGQRRLLASKVLLVGAGGLGSPAAAYLAAAGVGTLSIVDFDRVDESNLQRQILHTTSRVGQTKVESARRALLDWNPGIDVRAHEERLSSENVDRLFAGHDVVLDGSDNFATRYLVNDACVKHRIPNVHGSVYRFEGQVSVFAAGRGPCYRCLYPEPPPADLAPSCAEAGVLGVLPGVIGLLEAVETIKLLLGVGEPLIGRLLLYDALKAEFRELALARDSACAVCVEGRPFPGYVDYDAVCATSGA